MGSAVCEFDSKKDLEFIGTETNSKAFDILRTFGIYPEGHIRLQIRIQQRERSLYQKPVQYISSSPRAVSRRYRLEHTE